MNPKFREAVESLHSKYEQLRDAEPYSKGSILPAKGVYLFSRDGKHFYVGRSDNIRRRLGHHTQSSSKTNQAALANLIALKEVNFVRDYMKGSK